MDRNHAYEATYTGLILLHKHRPDKISKIRGEQIGNGSTSNIFLCFLGTSDENNIERLNKPDPH